MRCVLEKDVFNSRTESVLGNFSLFAGYLVFCVLISSADRKSLLSASALSSDNPIFGMEPGIGSRLQLKDFHRVEVKDGRTVWEVRAKEAKYYAGDSVSHVDDAMVKIYRADNSSVHLSSNSARLHLEGTALGRAELEGNVTVLVDNSMRIYTDFAVYDSGVREINAPGHVEIKGEGYAVKGSGLDVAIDKDVLHLSEDVNSMFRPESDVPKLKGMFKK